MGFWVAFTIVCLPLCTLVMIGILVVAVIDYHKLAVRSAYTRGYRKAEGKQKDRRLKYFRLVPNEPIRAIRNHLELEEEGIDCLN